MSAYPTGEWLVMAVVLPLWVAVGLADWACHRRTGIERTSGWVESAFHWALFAQAGVGVLAVALLEVNAAVLALLLAAFVLHEATTYVELRYTVPKRHVGPAEQVVHSFMEMLPLVMLALLAAQRWDALRAAGGNADWALRLKAQPWPAAYLAGLVLAVFAFNVLPLAEEALRCWRQRARLRAGTPAPPAPR